MHLGKASAYAVFATVHIAERGLTRPVQGREIAKERGIPFGYLLKILQQLVRGDVLTSQVGRSGGFTLKRPASQTTLLDIIEAVEGPLKGSIAGVVNGDPMARRSVRLLSETCDSVASLTRTEFQKITVEALIQSSR